MAVFVNLEDDDIETPQDGQDPWNGGIDALKPAAAVAEREWNDVIAHNSKQHRDEPRDGAREPAVRENPNRNSMTQALGCYPIVISLASCIDLNTLDNLSRTCRQVRAGLLQYRKMLLVSTLRCGNEHIPVDPEETLRFRARARDYFYMEETGRHGGRPAKAGQCARDLVRECRRCGFVVCRNCAIKPPAPIVLRDRHRRLCLKCTKAPLGCIVKPPLGPEFTLKSEALQQAICHCDSEGVWLCQPCGRTIRSDDYDYKSVWKWRSQYTDVLSGLGTGIGDGDRGVRCGRDDNCCSAREQEQETDCDAADAWEADEDGYLSSGSASLGTTSATTGATSYNNSIWGGSGSHANGSGQGGLYPVSNGGGGGGGGGSDHRAPSPSLKPGYDRHEIEGIGGVMKRKRLRMVKVPGCVPEWPDEVAKGDIMGRELSGRTRSWCGWCWRVVPCRSDYEQR